MKALLACAFLLAGCGPVGKQIAIDLAACAVGTVPGAVGGIIPDVQNALEGAGVDWASSLEGIGVKAGVDAVACAIKSIVARLQHAESIGPSGVYAVARGQAWLEAHGYGKR